MRSQLCLRPLRCPSRWSLSSVAPSSWITYKLSWKRQGEDGFPDDNLMDVVLPLRYQTDLLFTRDQTDSSSHTFNLTYNIQNLGMFSVTELQFRAEIWAVTRGGNHLVHITEYSIEQAHRSLELLTSASIQLNSSSPMFLQEDSPVRQIVLELRRMRSTSSPSGSYWAAHWEVCCYWPYWSWPCGSSLLQQEEETGRGGAACSQWKAAEEL
ncbi:hypothetical protein INR49_022728 [Caranx melampygus]|nr:hypothetical protein INR49_022728 [Caranx melampygus]